MSTTEPTATPGTPEDVELLARELMGWQVSDDPLTIGEALNVGATPVLFTFKDGGGFGVVGPNLSGRWNPFTDAHHDVVVLERVREIWASTFCEERGAFLGALRREWFRRLPPEESNAPRLAWYAQYVTGDYARAALAVLRSTTTPERGDHQ